MGFHITWFGDLMMAADCLNVEKRSCPDRKSPRTNCGSAAHFEPMEGRILLSVVDPTSSTVSTIVYTKSWNSSGIVDGFIPVGSNLSDKVFSFTDDEGTHTSHSYADAYTEGNDPGWILPVINIGKMAAHASTSGTITNGQNMVAMGQSAGTLDYVISIRQTQPLPASFTATFNVPIVTEFDLSASVTGNPGLTMETGNSSAYVEVCLSGGAQYFRKEAKVEWPADQGKADEMGDAQDLQDATFSNTIAYSPKTQGSDYLSVVLNASGYTMVSPLYTGAAKMETTSLANASSVAFDQLAFEQAQGAKAFILSDYFEFVLGWDPSLPVPGTPGKPGKTGGTLSVTCTTPDLVDLSDTGVSDTDDITGDLTPTFEGLAYSGTKPLKSGQVILYVDGTEAGRGLVSNGAYRVTTWSELAAGGHAVTVSAGASEILMGPRSSALAMSIDTDLPRGDTTVVTLGEGGAKSITFTDSDGTIATLKLSGGTAALTFVGDGLGVITGKSGVTVIGTDLLITSLDINGQTDKGKLTFTCKGSHDGDKYIDIGDISVAGSIASISAAGVNLQGNLTLGGSVASLTVNGVAAGQHTIEAVSIGTFKVYGDLNDATITLTQGVVAGQPKVMALGTLTVGGAMNASTIESAGHIGKATIGQMMDSTVFAGVDTARNALGVLPDEAQDFLAAATLGSLTISGVKGQTIGFEGSYIAAANLGKISLMGLPADQTADGGVAGDQLQNLYSRKAGKQTAFSLKGPLTASQMIETLDDYIARVV